MENKIKYILNNIEKKHLQDFQIKINEVLSFCESPIEKLMMLQFYNYFQKNNTDNVDKGDGMFRDIEFTEDCMEYDDNSLQFNKKDIEKIKKYEYRFNKIGQNYSKLNGFKFQLNYLPKKLSKNNTISFTHTRSVYISPQYEVNINNDIFRIDICLILTENDFFSGDLIDIKKIALECDGYEYHSSPDQKMNDEIRTRKLKSNGWHDVLRYSGKEIYRVGANLQMVKYNFDEIMEIIFR